jgi:hypothetical protein
MTALMAGVSNQSVQICLPSSQQGLERTIDADVSKRRSLGMSLIASMVDESQASSETMDQKHGVTSAQGSSYLELSCDLTIESHLRDRGRW